MRSTASQESIRSPSDSTLASLWARPRRADSSFQAQRAAHPAHPVGGHRLAVARAAEDDAALGVAAGDRLGHRADEQRVVDRHLGVGAEVDHLVAGVQEAVLDPFLVAVAGVVRADGDAQQPGGGDDAARRVGVGERLEQRRLDRLGRPGEAGEELPPFRRGRELRRHQHRVEVDSGRERLGDQVGTLEQRAGSFTSQEPAHSLELRILTARDHDTRS
jgi:hypothetical protein